jgi:hypothetical protein
MKKLLMVAAATLLTTTAFAALEGAPFQPHDDKRFDTNETNITSLTTAQTQTADGNLVKRVVRANLDCGVSDCSVGTVSMVQTLPANAIIYQSYWYTETQFVDGGSGTVAFHCEDANNIFTAADITGNADGSIVAGNATGVIATMTAAIAAECTITATIATAEQTAGVLTLFVEYVVHD